MEIYEIYSDESNYNQTNYGSIGVLSGKKEYLDLLKNELNNSLIKYGKKEKGIEFKSIDGDSIKTALGKEFILSGIKFCSSKNIRIDILTWNKSDSRNFINGRDDIQNMIRMYYHILHNTKKIWKKETLDWNFYPDEHTAINWKNDVIKHIENTNLSKNNILENTIFGELKNFHYPKINNHNEIKSHENNLLQLIDIFTSLCNFSFQNGKNYLDWLGGEKQECRFTGYSPTLFQDYKKHSKGNKAKFEILDLLINESKNKKLGISFNTNCYLNSPDKGLRSNINFWLYEPQHKNDKAPIKK